jgi:hypothetical protein
MLAYKSSIGTYCLQTARAEPERRAVLQKNSRNVITIMLYRYV